MSYLLDTNILSELHKRKKNPGLLDWMAASATSDHRVSVLTIGEMHRGVTRLRRRGDEKQADALATAVAGIEDRFGDRIEPVTTAIVRAWAQQPPQSNIPVIDGLIAATAAVRGLTVVTRNVRDFEPTGVAVLNPFTA